jgi:PTH2 family peptidyl-tRNA hydrolase
MKQVIVLRDDLGLSTGKAAAQVAHASGWAKDKANQKDIQQWKENGTQKVVLQATSKEQLTQLHDQASENIPSAIVTDQGRTEIEQGTVTALGIGPTTENKIDNVTGHLSLY